jgi:hypothetical protein
VSPISRYLAPALAIACLSVLPLAAEQHADRATEPKPDFESLDAKRLSEDKASYHYTELKDEMREGYARSELAAASSYQDWRRYNEAPYLSQMHGSRYVNNYANEAARGYGQGEDAPAMPPGAVIAKDSFAFTNDGRVYPDSLFLMEKLEAGANPATADWRYVMVSPEGAVIGDSTGANPRRVDFCHGCHRAMDENDYLFHVPDDYSTMR